MERIFNKTVINVFSITSIIIVLATLIGTIGQYLEIKWSIGFVIVILLLSFFINNKIKQIIIPLSSRNSSILLIVGIISFCIYGQYSPNLEIRQDPALYTFRTMNLINYGTTYKETPVLDELIDKEILDVDNYTGYAKILNGTNYENGRINVDFYSGGSYVNALLGVFDKDLSFLGNSIIAVLISINLYLIILQFNYFKKRGYLAGIITLIYMLSPINTWFFRGSYSEGIACLIFLYLIYLWQLENEHIQSRYLKTLIILVTLAAITIRIDYIIILAINIFLMTYKHPRWGALITTLAVLMNLVLMNIYNIYYTRIAAIDMPIMKYCNVLVIIVFIISLIFYMIKPKISLEEICNNKYINKIIIVVSVILIALIFRDNIVSPENYEVEMIHGNMLRTYNEEIFDRLFLVFPTFILIIGIVMLYWVFIEKEIALNTRLFMMGIFIPYSYYFYRAGNSPQLYWNIRRYTYILIPMLFIGFIYFISRLKTKQALVIALVGGISILNLQLEARQIVEFRGLHKSVKEIEEKYLTEDILVLYDSNLKYNLSSLISYSDNEFIPINSGRDINKIIEFINKPIMYMSSQPINNNSGTINIAYERLGESYEELPKDVQNKDYLIYITMLDQLNSQEQKEYIYPNSANRVEGIFEDGWTGGDAVITVTGDNKLQSNELIIEMREYSNPLLEQDRLSLVVTINNIEVKDIRYEEDKIIITIPPTVESIEKLTIESGTFTPIQEEIGQDTRNLGINIERIY